MDKSYALSNSRSAREARSQPSTLMKMKQGRYDFIFLANSPKRVSLEMPISLLFSLMQVHSHSLNQAVYSGRDSNNTRHVSLLCI